MCRCLFSKWKTSSQFYTPHTGFSTEILDQDEPGHIEDEQGLIIDEPGHVVDEPGLVVDEPRHKGFSQLHSRGGGHNTTPFESELACKLFPFSIVYRF